MTQVSKGTASRSPKGRIGSGFRTKRSRARQERSSPRVIVGAPRCIRLREERFDERPCGQRNRLGHLRHAFQNPQATAAANIQRATLFAESPERPTRSSSGAGLVETKVLATSSNYDPASYVVGFRTNALRHAQLQNAQARMNSADVLLPTGFSDERSAGSGQQGPTSPQSVEARPALPVRGPACSRACRRRLRTASADRVRRKRSSCIRRAGSG